MNNVQKLLYEAQRLGIWLSAQSNQLRIDAPKTVWTSELCQAFEREKLSILKLLSLTKPPCLSLFQVTLEEEKRMTLISPKCHEPDIFKLDMEKQFGKERIKEVRLIRLFQ